MSAYTPEEIAEHRAEWVAALRSGEYEQGHFRLRSEGDKYCCLGVAEVLAGTPCVAEGGRYRFGVHGESLGLTENGKSWLGVSRRSSDKLRDGRSLPDLNDGDGDNRPLTFAEIADLIETVGLAE